MCAFMCVYRYVHMCLYVCMSCVHACCVCLWCYTVAGVHARHVSTCPGVLSAGATRGVAGVCVCVCVRACVRACVRVQEGFSEDPRLSAELGVAQVLGEQGDGPGPLGPRTYLAADKVAAVGKHYIAYVLCSASFRALCMHARLYVRWVSCMLCNACNVVGARLDASL